MTTNAQLALQAVNSIGRDIVLMSTCGVVSDWGARLLCGVFADWFAEERDAWERVWPEASHRADNVSEEFALEAVYEDADTVDLHREDWERYEERPNYRYASRG